MRDAANFTVRCELWQSAAPMLLLAGRQDNRVELRRREVMKVVLICRRLHASVRSRDGLAARPNSAATAASKPRVMGQMVGKWPSLPAGDF